MMNVAIENELLEKNPVEKIKRLPEPTKCGRRLTPDELKRLFKALDVAINQQAGLAIKLLLLTGMRKGECLKIQWKDVDFKQGLIKLVSSTTKANKGRDVVLNPSAIEILRALEERRVAGNPYVFPGRKEGESLTCVRNTFRQCKEIAGIEDFRLHDTRHTFCSILVAENVSPAVIQELLGHQSLAMTQRYIHLQPENLREASKRVSEQMRSAA
jgi:integrase